MMTPNPLTQLRDIHLPKPIGWWPLASGWYFLGCLLLLLIFYGGYQGIKWLRRHRKQDQVIRQLQKLLQQYPANPASTLQALSMLVRRIALAIYPREEIAALHGDGWLRFLDTVGKTTAFSQGPGRCLAELPYQQNPAFDLDFHHLVKLVERWIRIVYK